MTTQATRAAATAVDAAIEAGKFPSSRRDHYLALHLSNPVGAQALLGVLTPAPAELRPDRAARDEPARLIASLWPSPVVGHPAADRVYDAVYPAP